MNITETSFAPYSFRGKVVLPPGTPSFNFDDYPAGTNFGKRFEFAEGLCSLYLDDNSSIIVEKKFSDGVEKSNTVSYRNTSVWINCPYKKLGIGITLSVSGSNAEIRLCKSRNTSDLISTNPILKTPNDRGLLYVRFRVISDDFAWIHVPNFGPDGHIKACDFLPIP